MTQRPAGIHGLNITDFGISRDNALADIRRMTGAFVLVRNSPQLAEMCADLGARVIYRQAGDDPGASPLATDPAEFVRVRAQAAPTAAFIHLLNEVDVSVGAADDYKRWNREAMAYLDRIGRKGCFDNFSTNMHYDRWMENYDNLQAAARGGHAIGAHFYPDGTHDSGGMDFLRVREQVGGLWLLTEFAYIQSIFDANRGWLGKLSVDDYRAFMRRWSEWAALHNLPLLWFSYEHWPNSAEGRASGFGLIDTPPLIDELAALNTRHTFKEVRPMPEYPFPPVGAAWQRGTFASRADYANVRAQPATSATIAGRLDKTPQTGAWVATDVVEAAGTWHALKLDSGTQGYVRADVVLFEAAPAPEPEPPTVPEPGTIYSAFLTKDEIVQLADLYEAAATIYRAAADRITVTEVQHLGVSASSAKESLVMPETPVTPVLGPILAMLRSRKFIIALASFLISLLTMAVPELAEVRESLLTVTIVLGLALIGGITLEDAAKAGKQEGPAAPALPPADALLELVKAALEAYFDRAELEVVELSPEEVDTIAESVRVKLAAAPKPDGALG
jgi:hypothetical protein